jgi:hypothetical protein
MFEKDLKTKLKTICGMDATFDAPSEACEQDRIFIEIEDVKSGSSVGTKKQSAKVTGNLVIFSQNSRLPFGFFRQRVEQAEPALKKAFFFGAEANRTTPILNIVERRCEFTFLFETQYDPNQGSLTSLDIGD